MPPNPQGNQQLDPQEEPSTPITPGVPASATPKQYIPGRLKKYLPQQSYAGGPEWTFGEGVHPVPQWMQQRMHEATLRQALTGKPDERYGDISTYVQRRLGYTPSYWEDPHRIAKWKNIVDALPPGAEVPPWIDKAKLDAAFKYLEQANGGSPWWTWKWLHSTDPGREFLQGFDMPPPEMLRPEELFYREGEALKDLSQATPIPGSPEWHKLDAWQKVMVSLFGSGPGIGEKYFGFLPEKYQRGVSSFGRGFAQSAPLGAGIGFFTTGFSPLGAAFGGLITGAIGGVSQAKLGEIQYREAQGRGAASDPVLEQMLIGGLGLLQYPAAQLERAIGVGVQSYGALTDQERYGPISEVFANLQIEFPSSFQETELGSRGPIIPLPSIGGPTGEAASLTYETATGVSRVITSGLDWLSASLFAEEEYQPQRPDEVWDLGGLAPHRIGPNTPETSAMIWKWALTEARRELMTTDRAPSDVALEIGQRFGIGGVLSDLFIQSILDPLNFAPAVNTRLLGRVAQEGSLIGKLLRIKPTEQAALAEAVRMLAGQGAGFSVEGLKEVRGVASFLAYTRAGFQVGGIDVIRHLANILRTHEDLGRIEVVKDMGSFSRWLAGVDEEGNPAIGKEPTGMLGRLFGLTPKSRATKFIFGSTDAVKFILQTSDDPNAIFHAFSRLASTDGQAAQELGLRFLGTPDGHLPIMAMRDFKVGTLKAFVDTWNETAPARRVLTALTRLMGNADDNATIVQFKRFGDGAWARLLDQVRKGVGEGDQAALAMSAMMDAGLITKQVLDATIKSLVDGKIPYHPDHIRYQMLDAWLDHVTKWAIKHMGVKIENTAYRLSNALKQGASIMLLDGNPFYLYANVMNNLATSAFDGALGFKSMGQIVRWWTDFGLSPIKLQQSFGGPGTLSEIGLPEGGKAEIGKMDLMEAVAAGVEPRDWMLAHQGEAMKTLSDKVRGTGGITALDRFFGGLRNKNGQTGLGRWSPLIFSRLSHSAEALQGANAYTKGTQSWWSRAWRRSTGFDRMPGHVEDALGPTLTERVYGLIEGELNYGRIEKGLLEDGVIQAKVHQFAEAAAGTLRNKSAADVIDMLQATDALAFLEETLSRAKTPDDVRLAFDEMDKHVQAHINALHTEEIKVKVAEVAEQVKAGDLTGFLDGWIDLQRRLEEWNVSHILEWGNVVDEANDLAASGDATGANSLYETRLAYAQAEAGRAMDMQVATVDGLIDGLRQAGIEVGDKYALGLRVQIAEWRSFFETRDRLWKAYGESRKANTLQAGAYAETVQRLGFLYDERIKDTIDIQEQMDQTVLDATHRVNPEAAEALAPVLADIREHQAKMYLHEAAVRDAVFDVWNAKTGKDVAATLRRVFADTPELLIAFEQFIKKMARRGDLELKEIRTIRRQIYELWGEEVKIKHIQEYYAIRGQGISEVVGGSKPEAPQVQRTGRPTVQAERLGVEIEQARVDELQAEGKSPAEAKQQATNEAVAARVKVDLTKDVTLDELRKLARDAGIATANKAGRGTDTHLLNVLNKDLGLEGELRLRTLEDLAGIEGAEQQNVMVAARQKLVNRAFKRLRYREEGAVTGLSVEALETLDEGFEKAGKKKLARIAEQLGTEEASLMSKQQLWGELNRRRSRGRSLIDGMTPTGLKERLLTFLMDKGHSEQQAKGLMAVTEAIGEAKGEDVVRFVAQQFGLDDDVAAEALMETYWQAGRGMEHPWVQQLVKYVTGHGGALGARTSYLGFMLPDGSLLSLPAGMSHMMAVVMAEIVPDSFNGLQEFTARTGAVRIRQLDSSHFAADIRARPSPAQIDALSDRAVAARAVVLEYQRPDGDYITKSWETRPDPDEVATFLRQAQNNSAQVLYQKGELRQMAPTFYSKMARLVDAKMPDRMPADQLLAFLKNGGIKPEELRWSLIEDLIEQRTKQPVRHMPEGQVKAGGQPIIEKSEVLALTKLFEAQAKETTYPSRVQAVELRPVDEWTPIQRWGRYRGGREVIPGDPPTGYRRSYDIIDEPRHGVPGGEGITYRITSLTAVADRPLVWQIETPVHTPRRYDYDPRSQELVVQTFETAEQAMAAVDSLGWMSSSDPAKYEQWTYPGGTNYREFVLYFPEKTTWGRAYEEAILAAIDSYPDLSNMRRGLEPGLSAGERLPPSRPDQPYAIGDAFALFADDPGLVRSKYPALADAIETYRAFENVVTNEAQTEAGVIRPGGERGRVYSDYKSSHWSELNPFAHVRTKERFLPTGERVLFIEEFQSDFGQNALMQRKHQEWYDLEQELKDLRVDRETLTSDIAMIGRRTVGLAGEPGGVETRSRRLNLTLDEINERAAAISPRAEKLQADLEEAGMRLARLVLDPRPPDPIPLPFEKTWSEYAIRRMLRLAAEEGYDGLMWNDGDGMFYAETNRTPGEAGITPEGGNRAIEVEWRRWEGDEQGTLPGSEAPLNSLRIVYGDGRVYDNPAIRYGEAEHILGLAGVDILSLENESAIYRGFVQEAGEQEGVGAGFHVYEAGRGELPDTIGDKRFDRIHKGLKAFYEDILPNQANKIVKRFGGKVERADFQSYKPAEIQVGADRYLIEPKGGHLAVSIQDVNGGWSLYDEFRSLDQAAGLLNMTTANLERFIIGIEDEGKHPGFLIRMTDEMREATLYDGQPLFQTKSSKEIAATELAARTLLVKEVSRFVGGRAPGFVSRIMNGEHLVDVLNDRTGGKIFEVDEALWNAWQEWKGAMQDVAWSESQGKLFQPGQRMLPDSPREMIAKIEQRIETLNAWLDTLEDGNARRVVTDEIAQAREEQGFIEKFGRELTPTEMWIERSGGPSGIRYQGEKGVTLLRQNGKRVIRALKNPDFSTALHELGHVFRGTLIPSEMDVVKTWLGKQGVKVDHLDGRFLGTEDLVRQAEELFARGFERYFAEGISPTPELTSIFAKMKEWLLAVYRAIKGSGIDVPLSEPMRQLFSDMLGGRAPDFDVEAVTWQKIKADAELVGRPRITADEPPTLPATPPPPRMVPAISKLGGAVGMSSTAHGADPNVTYEFRYRVMDLAEIKTSHTLGGDLTEGYPKSLQPRDRSRAASLRQSQQIASTLNPEAMLSTTTRIDDGSPIIGPDGLVESGNGRVNALRIAKQDFPENYQAYKQNLQDAILEGRYGEISTAAMGESPVLVRERLTDVDRFEFAKLANEAATMGMSPAEQALSDIGRLTDKMLSNLVIGESQTAQDAIKSTVNQGFVRQFVEQLPRGEQGEVMTRTGEISKAGMNRILQAIFMFVYGDGSSLRLAENVFESADPVMLNITNGMMQAAGDMAKMKNLILSDRRPESLDLTIDLAKAIDRLLSMKEAGTSIEDFTGQAALPGMQGPPQGFELELLVDLNSRGRSAKAIRQLLQNYAILVEQQPETGQLGLLGDVEYPSRAELYARAKDLPAQRPESQLFQLPETAQMRFADQIPPMQESAAKLSEGYQNMRPAIEALRDQMSGPEGWTQQVKSEDIRGRLSESDQVDFVKWLKTVKGDMASTKFSAMKWGESVRDFTMLDYNAQRGIDTNFLGIPTNYAFWPSRTIMRWLLRTANYPALMALYARWNEARRKQEERPGFPRRLKGKIFLPLPWLPEWMGGGLWVDPIRQFYPPAAFMQSFERVAVEQNKTAKRAGYILEKWVEDGKVDRQLAAEAIETQQGETWDLAVAESKAQLEQEFSDPLDYVQLVTGLSLPVSIAREFLRGTPERIAPLPATRFIKTATSTLSQATGIGDPAGINIERPLRRLANMPDWDRFEDYRVDRMLSVMMADGDIEVREGLLAGQEKTGPVYEEAVRRVNTARNYGIYANPLFWIAGLGGDTFPTGEQAQRNLGEELGRAITARDLGDMTAINRFFEKYPEYEGRLASFDTQEERFRSFLIDEVWTKYRELGSANKELVRLQLGADFEDMFLSNDTRSYDDIPLEMLAAWAESMGGYVPANAENRVDYKPLVPDLLMLPPAEAKIIDDFRALRNKKFPNWYAVQQGYYTSGPRGSQERKDYLARLPELEEYWDWKDDQFAGNQLLEEYNRRYDLDNREAGSLGSLRIPEIITNPILMRQLVANRYSDQELTSGALEELRRIYELVGQPGGNFREWVDQVDLGQTATPGGGNQAYP